MARLQASLLAVAVAIAAAAMLATPASGASYTVGDPGGSWDTKTNLDDWASSIDFRSGDELVFKYDASVHDVVEVTREGYRTCSPANAVSAVLRSGADTVQLNATGRRYFICGVPGHCDAGMKLEVWVSDANCTTTLPPPAPICSGGSPTIVMSPGVISYGSGVAPGSSASLSSLLVTVASLLLCLLV
ncbi:hypothetical protein HU200_051072 [Digitaria exilis]|uniref:Phytocyanin domain-containing protein n=1 Tax=Digitaria exilis TaxID=1010633 RepID=A0A835E5C5_9POAL|nr:hypothetical protein HU200_051072 [Digitaria exilis]